MIKKLKITTFISSYLPILFYLVFGYLLVEGGYIVPVEVDSSFGLFIRIIMGACLLFVVGSSLIISLPSKFLKSKDGSVTRSRLIRYFILTQRLPVCLQIVFLGAFLFTANYYLFLALLALTIPVTHLVYLYNKSIIKKFGPEIETEDSGPNFSSGE